MMIKALLISLFLTPTAVLAMGPPFWSASNPTPTGGGGGDTPVVASTAETATTSPWTGVVFTKPSGAVEGDLVIGASVSHEGGVSATVTPPSGFTEIPGGAAYAYSRLHPSFRVLGAGEPATWTTGAEQGSFADGVSLRITGASGIDASAYTESETPTASVVCPSVTTTGDNRLILNLFTAGKYESLPNVTYDAGTAEVLQGSLASVAPYVRWAVAKFEQPEAGATGTRTHTLSAASDSYICITVAVEP